MPVKAQPISQMELWSVMMEAPQQMQQWSQVAAQVQSYQQKQAEKTIDIDKFKQWYANAIGNWYKWSTSDFASSLTKEWYVVSWFSDYQKNVAHWTYKNNANKYFRDIVTSFTSGFKDFGSNIVQKATERSDQIGENWERLSGKWLGEWATFMAWLVKEWAWFVQDVIGETVTWLAKTAWNNLDPVEKTQLAWYADQIMQSPVAQEWLKLIEQGWEAYKQFEQENPDAATWVWAIANVWLTYADLVWAGQALKWAKAWAMWVKESLQQSLTRWSNAWSDVGKKTADWFENITSYVKNINKLAPEEASKQVANKLLEQIEWSKYLWKNLDKKTTDVIDTLSKNPDYLPDINVDAKAFDTKWAVQAIKSDIGLIGDNLWQLFNKADEVMKPIKQEDIVRNVSKYLINEKNRAKYIAAWEWVFNNIADTVNRLVKSYPDGVPRNALWEVRQSVDDVINKISDTDIQKSIRSDFRKALASTLEESVQYGDKNIVNQAMKEMQKRIDAADYLRDVLQWSKIQWGRLTDIIRDAVASDIGKSVGAWIWAAAWWALWAWVWSVPWAVVWYTVSKKIGNWLAKNAISSSAERKALSKFIKTNPNIIDEIKDLIKTMDKSDAETVLENLSKVDIK